MPFYYFVDRSSILEHFSKVVKNGWLSYISLNQKFACNNSQCKSTVKIIERKYLVTAFANLYSPSSECHNIPEGISGL